MIQVIAIATKRLFSRLTRIIVRAPCEICHGTGEDMNGDPCWYCSAD